MKELRKVSRNEISLILLMADSSIIKIFSINDFAKSHVDSFVDITSVDKMNFSSSTKSPIVFVPLLLSDKINNSLL